MSWIAIGSLLALAAVAAGAFGAHALRGTLPPERLEVFETAVRYQMYHAFATLVAGIVGAHRAAWAFVAGVVLFSGSLYLLVLTGRRGFGAITPIGGALFLLGWVLLAGSVRR